MKLPLGYRFLSTRSFNDNFLKNLDPNLGLNKQTEFFINFIKEKKEYNNNLIKTCFNTFWLHPVAIFLLLENKLSQSLPAELENQNLNLQNQSSSNYSVKPMRNIIQQAEQIMQQTMDFFSKLVEIPNNSDEIFINLDLKGDPNIKNPRIKDSEYLTIYAGIIIANGIDITRSLLEEAVSNNLGDIKIKNFTEQNNSLNIEMLSQEMEESKTELFKKRNHDIHILSKKNNVKHGKTILKLLT